MTVEATENSSPNSATEWLMLVRLFFAKKLKKPPRGENPRKKQAPKRPTKKPKK